MKQLLKLVAIFALVLLVACAAKEVVEPETTPVSEPEEVTPEVPVVEQPAEVKEETKADNVIIIGKDGRLDPFELTVSAGTSVTWKNDAGTKLVLVGDKNDKFSTTLDIDGEYSHTYETAGIYVYNYGVGSGKIIVE